jgi:purine-binding chemotaxis protein CheW
VTTTNIQSQFILFGLEEILFALPLASALEIGHRPEVTRLPNLPNWVLGISNIRGQIISLVNLKAFLGIPSSGIKTDSRFIIVHNQDLTVGIIVDRIMGMLSLDRIDTNIQNSPYREGDIAKFISGVAFHEDNLMNILDIEKLLSSPRMNSFKAG